MSTIKTVFITGVTGYIGRNVAGKFRRAGWRVLGLTRDAAKAASLTAQEITPVIGTLQDADKWRTIAATANVLVHAAVDYTTDTAALDRAVAETLVQVASQRGSTLIYTSGVWVHGSTGAHVADETTPLAPTPMVATRPVTERLVLEMKNARGIVIRPAIVYGHRGGLTAGFFSDQQVIGEGSNRWPLVHVDDLADAYLRAVERGSAGGIYLVADDSRVTVRELVAAAREAAGVSAPIQWLPVTEARKTLGPFADALALDQQVSAMKAQRELGWRPIHAGFIAEAATYAAANRA
jgi:nucleoside-diphosphate-sugar epimerase